MDSIWNLDMSVASRKTSLLEDEGEPHSLMMDSDVTQHSMDSLDEFNSDAEFIKLERSRTMPVAALYATIKRAEEDQALRLANGRSYSMGSIGSLWDQGYTKRATEYDREQETPVEAKRSESPPTHAFRLHTPIPEEDCSSNSNESITYVFMNPNQPPNETPMTNPSAIMRNRSGRNEDYSYHHNPADSSYGRSLAKQPRSLSVDSIDVEECMNMMQHRNLESQQRPTESNSRTTRYRKTRGEIRRDNSRLNIESTDQEYSGMEQTPYYVESATTDPETGSEQAPRSWHVNRRIRKDSESDVESNVWTKTNQHPRQAMVNRRSSTKTRRKPSRTRAMETQTDEEFVGYLSQPNSPGADRKSYAPQNYALMRSITAGTPLGNVIGQSEGKLEPTINLLSEVVSLMKLMVTNMPKQCQPCHKCQCTNQCEQATSIKSGDVRPLRPNKLNLSSFSDTASSDPEPGPVSMNRSAFKEGFFVERFRQSRQDRIATCRSTSDIASLVSDVEPDSLRVSGASTPTDDFRSFPIPSMKIPKTPSMILKSSPTETADSGISDRWESQGSSCGSTVSHRNRSRVSSESTSAGPSSLSSNDTPDSSLNTATVLTQWSKLNAEPVRTSTPVKHTGWTRQRSLDADTSTETALSYKTTNSYLSRADSLDDSFELPNPLPTRPSKIVMKLEKHRQEQDLNQSRRKPLQELKEKWQKPCDLIPSDTFLPLPSVQTKLRCSPDIHRTL